MPRPVVPIFWPPADCLAQLVELAMQRQNERGVLRDLQALRGDVDALRLQALDLVHQMPRIEHHAVADDAELARPHHAGRQQRQLVGDAVDDERMAGIVAALEAHDDVGALRKPVDDLALALVAPLGADHDHVCHGNPRVARSRDIATRAPLPPNATPVGRKPEARRRRHLAEVRRGASGTCPGGAHWRAADASRVRPARCRQCPPRRSGDR